jgi:hypothetical protein
MKKLLLILAFGFTGAFAHAQDVTPMIDQDGMSPMSDELTAQSAWVCGLHFKGTSKGIQLIVGKFTTVAYGTLHCKGFKGTYTRDVKITMGGKCIGLTAGIGYFKIKGVSSEISLFNSDPSMILGKYLSVNGEAAIIGGVGTFAAVKVGMPQLAFNISVQLVGGLGLKAGVEKLRITAVDHDEPDPQQPK